MTSNAVVGRRAILRQAWPIILANAAVPTLGLVDTAVIGNLGTTAQLGAIALGAVIFSFVYWSFGFLRMGTTGFTAQAAGRRDEAEVRATLGRALLIALGIGLVLIALQAPLAWTALQLLGGSQEVESVARDYFLVRIWGAPATLAAFALIGALIGLGRSRTLLAVQLFLNCLNILLDVYFAGVLGMGAKGIALGTALSEWITCLLAIAVVVRLLKTRRRDGEALWPWHRIVDRKKLRRTLAANTDILVRTLTLVFAFAFFANQGAQYGNVTLAANHILLQLISFSAFFLDGYAFVVESLVGTAIGAKRYDGFRKSVRHSSEIAGVTAVMLAVTIFLLGAEVINLLTDLPEVRQLARSLLPWCALYVLLAVAAFQLDGIFIGATRTGEMRNAALLSLTLFLVSWLPLSAALGNDGLWLAFIVYVIARALSLLIFYPSIRRCFT
ncbi:MATE family efflux transporter [Proteobacteria bacterium 005FR1]|nr:MATE family efflux transporter [Proteobacteria bacterium 005FR1]